MTTLFAARREDLTAVLGAHALEKTVDALASAVVRLEGPFHGTDTPNIRLNEKHCIVPVRGFASQGKTQDCERFLRCPHLWTGLWITLGRSAAQTLARRAFLPHKRGPKKLRTTLESARFIERLSPLVACG